MAFKLIHYINQFYAGIGGEEEASTTEPTIVEGIVGPGGAFKNALGYEAEITHTFYCGDQYFVDHETEVIDYFLTRLRTYEFDGMILGPSFNANMYSLACFTLGKQVYKEFNIPVVAGMYFDSYQNNKTKYNRPFYICKTKDSATGMKTAIPAMSSLMLKLLKDETVNPITDDYYGLDRIDCQYDETNNTNSFVVGRASNSSDLGSLVISNNCNFNNEIYFDLEADDYGLARLINSLGWTDVYVDDNGNSLGV